MKIKKYEKHEVGTGEITKEYAEQVFNELLAFQGYGFCLGYDVEVEVKDVGKVPLGKLKGNEYIKAPAMGMDYKWVKVINIIPMGKKEAYKVTLDNNKEIICTIDHKFLCSDNKKHSIEYIINNNKLKEPTSELLLLYGEDKNYIINKIEYIEEKIPVMDITVDSDEHLFFANGIAVSNCAAHAKAYSVYSAVQMWLQEYYFIEYMCVLLSHIDRAKEKKGESVLNERVSYCVKHGTYIYYPDVNESEDKWLIKAGGLLAPIKNIKGFSDREVNIIKQNRPYKDLKDFLDKTEFNNKRFESLLFANAFNKWGNVEDLYNWYYNHYFEKNKKKKEVLTNDLFSEFGIEDNNQSSNVESIKTFTKSELEEKCMDLNGFVIPDNIMIRFHEVYEKHLRDYVKCINEDAKEARFKIYKLADLYTMQKTDKSEAVWVLAQVKNIATNLRTKKGSPFSKVILTDGETNLELYIWKSHLPSFFKKGNVLILPMRVITDEEKGENNITFAAWKADDIDIPILEYGE